MKQEEKKLLSQQKIVEGALTEFANHTYQTASLNNICAANGLSKGIIYHYYKDKKELYLSCANDCFQKLVAHLETSTYPKDSVNESLAMYFESRLAFFQNFPCYYAIFCEVILHPPVELIPELLEVRAAFDSYNKTYFMNLIEHLTLRDNVTKEDAIDYFNFLQDSFNFHFYQNSKRNNSPTILFKEHEERLLKTIKLALYGLAKEDSL